MSCCCTRGSRPPRSSSSSRTSWRRRHPSAFSIANNCVDNKVIAVRFDDMDPGVNFAALAWDRALLLKDFDKAALLTFANQWQDGPQTPEAIC